jgi:hypothetical protein
MHRLFGTVAMVTVVGGAFWCGRLSSRPPLATSRSDSPRALRNEIAELKQATSVLRRSLMLITAPDARREVARPCKTHPEPAGTVPAAMASSDAPPSEGLPVEEQDAERPELRDAEALVTASMARGTWTERDVARFRELTQTASDVDWVPLLQTITTGINSGRLQMNDSIDAPF